MNSDVRKIKIQIEVETTHHQNDNDYEQGFIRVSYTSPFSESLNTLFVIPKSAIIEEQ